MTDSQRIIYEKLRLARKEEIRISREYEVRFEDVDKLIQSAQHDVGFHYETPITSKKRGVGKIIVAYKKFIRKSIAFIMGPILAEQTEKNKRFYKILHHLSEIQRMMKKDMEQETARVKNELRRLDGMLKQKSNDIKSGALENRE